MRQAEISRRDVGRWLLAAAAVSAAGCGRPQNALRVAITLELMGPSGLLSGTSVVAWTMMGPSPTPGGEGYPMDLEGEAVAVELPSGPLFLRPDPGRLLSVALAHGTITPPPPARLVKGVPQTGLELMAALASSNARIVLPGAAIVRLQPPGFDRPGVDPLLFRFRDIADPMSVEQVDAEDLTDSLGPSLRLHRLVVAVTDAPLSAGLERRIPWLARLPQMPPNLGPGRGGPPNACDLISSRFARKQRMVVVAR